MQRNCYYSNPIKSISMIPTKACTFVVACFEKESIQLVFLLRNKLAFLDKVDSYKRVTDVLVDHRDQISLYLVVPKYQLHEYRITIPAKL